MSKFKKIKLYNNHEIEIRTHDCIYLGKKLEEYVDIIRNYAPPLDEPGIGDASCLYGYMIGAFDMERICTKLKPINIRGIQMHPMRSIGHYGISIWSLGHLANEPNSRTVFEKTRDYFKEAFFVHSAFSLENQRENQDQDYLAKLDYETRAIEKEYMKMIAMQTDTLKLFACKN